VRGLPEAPQPGAPLAASTGSFVSGPRVWALARALGVSREESDLDGSEGGDLDAKNPDARDPAGRLRLGGEQAAN
jgi:hypothetical protein